MLNIHTPNSQQYGQIVLGVLGMGGILSTANPAYTVHELNYQMKLTGAKALFTDTNSLDTARQVADQCGIGMLLC